MGLIVSRCESSCGSNLLTFNSCPDWQAQYLTISKTADDVKVNWQAFLSIKYQTLAGSQKPKTGIDLLCLDKHKGMSYSHFVSNFSLNSIFTYILYKINKRIWISFRASTTSSMNLTITVYFIESVHKASELPGSQKEPYKCIYFSFSQYIYIPIYVCVYI